MIKIEKIDIATSITQGHSLPFVKFTLAIETVERVEELQKLILDVVDPFKKPFGLAGDAKSDIRRLYWHLADAIGYPLLGHGVDVDDGVLVEYWPSHANEAVSTFCLVVDFLNNRITEEQFLDGVNSLRGPILDVLETYCYVRAATEHGCTVVPISRRLIRVSKEDRACYFDGNMNSDVSIITQRLCQSKPAYLSLLSTMGVPVPKDKRVNNLEEAIKAANELGYPVVLKPEFGSNGYGVYPNIQNDAELTELVNKAGDTKLFVEKHVSGTDFRTNIVNGKVMGVLNREAAKVVGDGIHTIKELIDIANQDPVRYTRKWSMHPIKIDEETVRILKKHKVKLNSKPKKGQVVLLREVNNLSSGGYAKRYLGAIHPDNIALLEKIAKALCVRYVGIDVLAEDFSRSWKEGNFHVTDVNIGHSMSKYHLLELYPMVINQLLDNK